jgi:hypothetical protein
MAKLINLNLGWMTIGKKPWLPYDPTADLAFGAKAKSFDLFTPPPDGQWQRESRRSKRFFDTTDSAGSRSLIRIPCSA